MERDLIYFSLLAGGAVLLWVFYRGRASGRGRMALIASSIAVGIAYIILFQLLPAGF